MMNLPETFLSETRVHFYGFREPDPTHKRTVSIEIRAVGLPEDCFTCNVLMPFCLFALRQLVSFGLADQAGRDLASVLSQAGSRLIDVATRRIEIEASEGKTFYLDPLAIREPLKK